MKTSELIIKLINSLTSHGDLPTNIKDLSWYCPSENGHFEKIFLNDGLEGVDNVRIMGKKETD